uniref:catechol O-methyltransferase n=1 Tax=Xenopus tropicalis TaxID=8364 RepID=A0A6I8QQB6_XENTR
MLQVLLAVGMGALALLLFVVWRVRTDGAWALWWHDNYLERLRDFTSGQSRPMRILQFVQSAAAPGDANSAICAVDSYCANVEWAMNVGDKKGQILDAVVLAVRPRWVLELGTYCGYSTMRIARLLPPGARLVTLEMNQHYAQVAKQILGHAGLDTQVSRGYYSWGRGYYSWGRGYYSWEGYFMGKGVLFMGKGVLSIHGEGGIIHGKGVLFMGRGYYSREGGIIYREGGIIHGEGSIIHGKGVLFMGRGYYLWGGGNSNGEGVLFMVWG